MSALPIQEKQNSLRVWLFTTKKGTWAGFIKYFTLLILSTQFAKWITLSGLWILWMRWTRCDSSTNVACRQTANNIWLSASIAKRRLFVDAPPMDGWSAVKSNCATYAQWSRSSVARSCHKGKDGRRDLPKAIVNKLREANADWSQSKFEVKWIVCYINNILPDQTKQNWQLFECSHTCIEDFCVSPSCLCWESKSVNQSRGQSFCTKVCAHIGCDQIVCVCQSIHEPNCR